MFHEGRSRVTRLKGSRRGEPRPWPLETPLPWLLETPLPWLLKSPLPWLLKSPLPWLLETPLPWLLKSPLPWLLKSPQALRVKRRDERDECSNSSRSPERRTARSAGLS